jgi:hypothetical protein
VTAPLGSRYCIRTDLGCRRERHVSPSGIRYSTCLAHADELLARAFGTPRHDFPSRAADASPFGSGPRQDALAPSVVPATAN